MTIKNILIFGASKGIGRELVQVFAQKNHRIIAFSRDVESMQKTFGDFPNVKTCKLDLNLPIQKIQLREQIESYFTHVDIVVYNAGYLVNKPFLTLNREDLLQSYQVNVLAAFEVFQTALPMMQEKGGHVVSISSMGGFQGTVKFSGLSAYSSSKAALASLTELLAEEFKNSSIRFNCLALGAAQTEMIEKAFPGYKAPLSATEMAHYIADFSTTGNQWFNGKIIPVSLSTP
jgi:short-subunit dehydrogenase